MNPNHDIIIQLCRMEIVFYVVFQVVIESFRQQRSKLKERMKLRFVVTQTRIESFFFLFLLFCVSIASLKKSGKWKSPSAKSEKQ